MINAPTTEPGTAAESDRRFDNIKTMLGLTPESNCEARARLWELLAAEARAGWPAAFQATR